MIALPLLASVAAATTVAAAAPLAITPEILAGLPETTVVLPAHGPESHTCAGPLLSAVLERQGAPQGEALKGRALRKGVLVRARDGYAVLLSLGEIDPGLGKARAILATSCDHKPIDASEGPVRLVIAGDGRPARAVRQVSAIDWIDP